MLGLLVEACIRSQKTTKHRDPIHVTAHFMQPTAKSEYRVEIKVIRTGSRFSNLLANLVQDVSILFFCLPGKLTILLDRERLK